MKFEVSFIPLLGLAIAWSGSSSAGTIYTANLTADPTTASTSSFVSGDTLNNFTFLSLNGLASSPITVSVGDTVNLDITFSSAFTQPGAPDGSFNTYNVLLSSESFPGINTAAANNSYSLLAGGSPVVSFGSGAPTTTSGQLAIAGSEAAVSRTFDEIQLSLTVTDLSGTPSVLLDDGTLEIYQAIPVPLPGAAWLFTSALGLIGLRRRKA